MNGSAAHHSAAQGRSHGEQGPEATESDRAVESHAGEWRASAAMTFGSRCRVSWRSKVLGAVVGSNLLLCKVSPVGRHGESRTTHCFQEPGFKDERGVPELLSFAALRVASVFISEKANTPMEELREEDVVFVGSAFAFNRHSLATCAHLFQGPPRCLGALLPLAVYGGDVCREEDFQLRVQHALLGALLGDSFAWNEGEVSLEKLAVAEEEEHSSHGLELMQALRVVSMEGFEFQRFSAAWRNWADYVQEAEADRGWSPGAVEALSQLREGAPPEAAAGHYVDFGAIARLPALLLLAEHADENGLVMASQEMQRVTHENPKVLQAGEFFLRAALHLLRTSSIACTAADAVHERRAAMLEALRAAARCGAHFSGLVEEVLAEVTSRGAVLSVTGQLTGTLAAMHSDQEVISRLTSSGDSPGDEVQSEKTSFAIPAILWFVLAYDTLPAALAASSALGGAGSAPRGLVVALLLACRDGVGELFAEAQTQRLPLSFKPLLGHAPVLRLCSKPGSCHTSGRARETNGVRVDAAMLPEHSTSCAGRYCYRIFMRFDATHLLDEKTTEPVDWNEEEDGPWTPPETSASCLARYFQFSTESGRHAPFGLWPANAMCQFSRELLVWHDSFEVSVPEPLSGLIGGAVLKAGHRRVDVKLPSLSMEPKRPDWAEHCTHVGRVKLPPAEWIFEDVARVVVRFSDGRWANAQLRGSCTATDVAVLKLDEALSPLTFSRSLPKQGERVVVCGMTQHGQEVVGLSGLVSQPRQRFRGLPDDPTTHFVQLALPTLPGMSGSPVVNSEGKVCAMVAKKFEEHGLALPVERVLPVAECLEAGYPWRLPLLGMEVQAGGTLTNPSVVVKAFPSASAAAKAGVEVGDEILEINGTKMATLLEMREALLSLGDPRATPSKTCRVRLRLRRQSRTLDVAFDAPRAPSGPQDVSMIDSGAMEAKNGIAVEFQETLRTLALKEQAGLISQAFKLAPMDHGTPKLISLDVISYNAAVTACEKGGQWKQALIFVDTMSKARIRLNVISYNATISACEKGGQWQQALILCETMPKAKVSLDVISHNAAISACEKGGQWQHSLRLFEAMPKARISRNAISYNATMSAFEKGGQWQQALLLCEAMHRADISLDVISCNAAISACEKVGQWEQALILFKTMPTEKISPNVISYNAAISACEKGGQWQQALILCEAMHKAKTSLDVVSYSAAISACEKGGQWVHALILFEAMPRARVGSNVISYNATISACEKGGQWKHALAVFDAIPKANIRLDVISYNAAISACAKSSQWQQALILFEAMPKAKISSDVISYNAAISACERGVDGSKR
eukprot:s527_g2.t1